MSASCVTTAFLPAFRVKMSDHFAITGVDFAGPVHYKEKKSNTGKSYITLCTCASTRAVDLKLCCDFSSIGFQRALKEFIARGGCPQTIVRKTSSATGTWLSTLKKDHNLASYIEALNVNRTKFKIPQASWWGGFFACFILVS